MAFKCLQYKHSLFLNKILGLLFQTTHNQSPISPFSHLSLSLIPNYKCLRQLHLRLRFLFSIRYIISCCLPSASTSQSLETFHCFMCNSWHNFLFPLFPPSDMSLRGLCIFPLLQSCMFIHHNLKLQIITSVPDTSCRNVPFLTSTYFLDIICHFLERETCVSNESCDMNW
jgi:hypothetical protein